MYRHPEGAGRKPRAFTLIELLIVVAIIAILSAIATPNFLEAQTRSRVTRALADMRCQATAVASYRGDWNRHPRGPIEYQTQPGTVLPYGDNRWWNWTAGRGALTTPVAYLTTLPEDPFFRMTDRSPLDRYEWGEGYPFCVYFTLQDMILFTRHDCGLDWVTFFEQTNSRWGLVCRGPDGAFGMNYGNAPLKEPGLFYDATNGSSSHGSITYFEGPAFECCWFAGG